MIVAEQKPIIEIKEMVAPYRKLLVLGCGTCVKTCFAGGEDEVAALVSTLRLAFKVKGIDIKVEGLTVERQCEDEFIQEATELVDKLRPRVVIPMHFRTEKAALRFAEVDDFLVDKKGITRLDSSIYEVKSENLPEETQVIVLKPSR